MRARFVHREARMGARAMWKAELSLDGVTVPVKWYAAANERRVSFRMLDRKTEQPVEQRMLDAESEDEVSREAVRRGFEVEPGTFVLLTDEELESLAPKPSREVELVAFLSNDAIQPARYDRPYWLAPDGDDDAYFALAQAIAEREVVGVIRWTMRNRRYVGALRAEGPYLMVSTLRHLGEVLPVESLDAPSVEMDPREQKLADQLVEALADDFDPTAFREEYSERVRALIEAKAAGEAVAKRRPKAKKETSDLEESLRASVKALEKEKRVA